MQKFFFISSDIFADKTFKGIVEVLDEIIDEGLRASCILEYIECLISILSTTASTTQSASETAEKLSSIFPVSICSALVFSTSSGGLDFIILSLAFSVIWSVSYTHLRAHET